MTQVATPTIPFFNYPSVFRQDEENLLAVITDICRRGAYILQKELKQFEQNLAAYQGAKYAVGVANATDGLQIALEAAGIGRGDEVILSTHTFIATASAVHHVGATPVPVDIGWDGLMDPASFEAAITPRTKAVMPTQLNGRTCDMGPILEICKRRNVILMEDAAQGLGSKFDGKPAGTFGLAACISFYPAKVLGCFGDGGAVLTDSQEMYEKLLLLRDHGRGSDGKVWCWGVNTRLDNLQAAILDYKLKSYDDVVARRRAIAALYQSRLGELAAVQLPPAPDRDPRHFDIYQNYEIQADRRDELKAFLSQNGVGTIIQWGGFAVHEFEKLGFTQKLPKAEKFMRRALLLPINMAITDDEVHYVCNTIEDFYRNG